MVGLKMLPLGVISSQESSCRPRLAIRFVSCCCACAVLRQHYHMAFLLLLLLLCRTFMWYERSYACQQLLQQGLVACRQ